MQPTTPIPGVTSFAFSRLLTPDASAEALALTDEGHLRVSIRGETMTRTDALLLCSENVQVRPLNRRMQGRAVPEVFRRLVAVEGDGYLVLSRESERFYPLRLERDLCFFVERHLWAIDASLMWDVGTLPGTRETGGISLVRVAGEGQVAIRVGGELVAIKVSQDRPHRVRAGAFVGWVGNVIPQAMADGDFVHCEGEGAVFASLPRPESTAAVAEAPKSAAVS